MPIFKSGSKLIFYAHVPKCGGSAIAWYLKERFGQIAFSDSRFTDERTSPPWTRTSPQHIDHASLSRLFPPGFFDATFTIVRHPVARVVSAYHFQVDVERLIPQSTDFSEWLSDLEERLAEDPFVFDNHVRPMDDIVPEGAKVFYLEHGADALVPWFDEVTGEVAAPRGIPRINEKGATKGAGKAKVTPSAGDLDRIAAIYARDFDRFQYDIDTPSPRVQAPEIAPEQLEAREALQRELTAPMARVKRKVAKVFGR